MEKKHTKFYRFLSISATFCIIVSMLALNQSYEIKEIVIVNDDESSNEASQSEDLLYSLSNPIINIKSISSIKKRENVLIDSLSDSDFNYMSPIKKEFLQIDRSLIDFVGDDNYYRYISLQQTEYNCNVYSFIKYFNINEDLFTSLKLYTQEEVEILYSDDPQKIAELVILDGCYYLDETNTIYTVEWLYTASKDDILNEGILFENLILIIDKTLNVITNIVGENAGDLYKAKILDFDN